MAKVKAKQNKAKNVKTIQTVDISKKSTVDLALLLQQQYQQFMNIQTNIREITIELSKRKQNG